MLRMVLCHLGMILFIGCAASVPCTANDGNVFTYNGHTYEIVKEARTWIDAAKAAAKREKYGVAGALVRIDNAAENQAIYKHLIEAIPPSEFPNTNAPDGGGGAYVWLGASDRLHEGKWIWDVNGDKHGDPFWSGGKNGSPVDGRYYNWGTVNRVQNEPDNYHNQDAAGISLNGWPIPSRRLGLPGQWNDLNIDNKLYYLIEYPAVEAKP